MCVCVCVCVCAPKMRLLDLTSIGLTTYLQSGLGFPTLSYSRHKDKVKLPLLLSLIHSLFTLYFLGNLSTTLFFLQLLIYYSLKLVERL